MRCLSSAAWNPAAAAWLALCLAMCTRVASAADAAQASSNSLQGEWRLRADVRSANDAGPLAAANRLASGIAPVAPDTLQGEAELRSVWRGARLGVPTLQPLSVVADALLAAERPQRGATHAHARLNQAHVAGDLGAWQASVGKKIVAWDVGFGFRPNDVVQQEARRSLVSTQPEGRPLLEVERFGADGAVSLVWVNPHHASAAASSDPARQVPFGARESALALRVFQREGSADWFGFARWGEHTRASAGAALAWVVDDAWELHASARALQRHDGWAIDAAAGNALVTANPWREATLGRAMQALVGASWTGEAQQSVLIEAWHDGSVPADDDWRAWQARNVALAAFGAQPGLPPQAVLGAAGNLAWQATPFNSANLRRDNLLIRLSWQPQRWTWSLDALVTPADRGRVLTAAVQWQGEGVRLNAAWRTFGGPADSLMAQLPQRRIMLLAAAWPF